jgi:hypothetical protein
MTHLALAGTITRPFTGFSSHHVLLIEGEASAVAPSGTATATVFTTLNNEMTQRTKEWR